MAERQKTQYEIDMCHGPILSKMLRFSIPLMCSSVLQLLFNAADIVVVGRWAGDNSLAAVGSNTALIGLLTNLFVGLAVGANTLAAKYYGARDRDELHRVVHTSILLSMLSGLFLTVVGVLGARTILIWMQTPDNVLDLAALYLRIYFLGMPATMVYNFGAALLRAEGDTQRPLYYLSLAGVVNIVLNLFFVIVCHLDVAGVAIATVISQCISAALVLRCLVKDTGPLHLDLRKMRFHASTLRQILRIGLPAGFQGILFSLSNVVIQSSVNTFGETIMAGNSAAANLEQFVYVSMNAMYQATISFVSQNYGAGNYHRIRKIVIRAQCCVLVVGLVLGNAATFFGHTLLSIYTSSPAVIEAGLVRMGICCATYALCGMMDVMVGGLRGIGYSVMPMLVSLVGACGLRLLWIATIFQLPQFHTIQMLYWSYPVSWLITLSVHVLCFLWAMKRVKQQLLPSEAPASAELLEEESSQARASVYNSGAHPCGMRPAVASFSGFTAPASAGRPAPRRPPA